MQKRRLTSDFRLLAAVIAILLLATALRFHRLNSQSFWNDEGNSARLSERTISLIIEGTASDIHPPLYYLLLHGWRELAGETEFGLRALSAFLGIGVVALTITLGRAALTFGHPDKDGSKQPGPKKQITFGVVLLAGLLAAVNPALVYYSQEARMYQLLAFLGLFSTVLLLRWLKKGATLRTKIAIIYVVTLAAGLYTHYFFPAVIVVQAVILLIWGMMVVEQFGKLLNHFLRWLALVGAAVLLYLPWLPIFIRQAGGRPGIRLPLLAFIGDGGAFLAFGQTVELENLGWPLGILGLFLIIGLLPLRRRFNLFQIVAAAGLIFPVLLMWLAGTTTPPFYKFMLTAVPFLSLMAAYGFQRVSQFAEDSQHRALFFVAVSFLALFGLQSYTALDNLYNDPAYARADYRAIAARVTAENALPSSRNAAVILNAANQWEVFTYYYQDVAAVYPLPLGFPDQAQIEAELTGLAGQYSRLYVLFWGEAERDPERLVERWLDANTFKAGEEWIGDVRLVTYAVPAEPPGRMETAVNARFGDSITLEGYTIRPDPVQPGDILQVALFWQTAETLDSRYKVFLHLIGPDGRLWSQRDSEPGGNLALTTTWLPNEIIQDNHGLLIPIDAPPGLYTLLVGLYEISDPTDRLPVESATGQSDSIVIPLTVRN